MNEDSDYLISLYSFRDDTNLREFYDYCSESMELLSARKGFRSAFGYLSTYEEAKYRYVGVTELDSFDFLYSLTEEIGLAQRLTPPPDTRAMTIFASIRNRTHPWGAEHVETTDEAITMINPFSISHSERKSQMFDELCGRMVLAIGGQKGHLGYRGFHSTNPSSLHNYIGVSEWASEDDFLAWRQTDAYKIANTGAGHLVNSGYPALYKLVFGYTNKGMRIDNRNRVHSI